MNDVRQAIFPMWMAEAATAINAELEGPGLISVQGVTTDTRALQPGELYFALVGERFDGHTFAATALEQGAAGVVINREHGPVPRSALGAVLRVEDTLRAYGDLARWVRRNQDVPTIGLTGSVGKTTTKELLAACLRRAYNVHATQGNYNNLIGVPRTIMSGPVGMQYQVIEMGTDRPGEIERLAEVVQPQGGLVTAIAPSHLERFHAVEAIVYEKGCLLEALPENGWAVIPASGTGATELASRCKCSTMTFGVEEAADVRAEDVTIDAEGCPRLRLELPDGGYELRLRLPGMHQATLAAAAAGAAYRAGVPGAHIAEGLESVRAIAGRAQVMHLDHDVTVVADYYNANPASMTAALQLLQRMPGQRKVAVLGDMFELGPDAERWHLLVGERVAGAQVDTLYGAGRLARRICEAAVNAGVDRHAVQWWDGTETAAAAIAELIQPGDTVLVKASRGMTFERIADAIVHRYAVRPANGTGTAGGYEGSGRQAAACRYHW